MKKTVALLTIFFLLIFGSASAEILKGGITIKEARSSMSKAGYKKSGLDMEAGKRSHSLEFWSVGGGTLIALYSRKSNEIIKFFFILSDERPKGSRKSFEFSVVNFDTKTGQMTIKTKKKKSG